MIYCKRMLWVLALSCLLPLAALAGIGGDESYVTVATSGSMSLYCLPDGNGSAFTEAYIKGGYGGAQVTADATLTLYLLDINHMPVPNYPAEDIWLQWVDETNLHICTGGTIPDADSDAAGVTTWVSPLKLGGYSESLVQVRVNGNALTTSAGIALSVNSPDISGDGNVDLLDVASFAQDFAEWTTAYRSDFVNDGVINVADIGKMAVGVGASCP